MKTTRKILVLHAILSGGFFFTSCQPEAVPAPAPAPTPVSPASVYYMRFKIDGVPHQYSAFGDNAMVNIFNPNDSTYYGQFLGCGNAQDYTRDYAAVHFTSDYPLSLNTLYTNFTPTSGPGQKLRYLSVSYMDENGLGFFSFDETLYTPLGLLSTGNFTITDTTATYVKAVFSAKLYDNSFTLVHDLTDGELYLERIQ